MRIYVAAALGVVSFVVLLLIEYRDTTRATLLRSRGTETQARILVAEIEPPALLDYPAPATMDILYAFQPPGMEVMVGYGSIPLKGDEDEARLRNRYHEGAPLAIRYLAEDVDTSLPVDGLDDNARFSWDGLWLDFAAVLLVLIVAIGREIRHRRMNRWPPVGMAPGSAGARSRAGGQRSQDAQDQRTSGPQKARFGKRC